MNRDANKVSEILRRLAEKLELTQEDLKKIGDAVKPEWDDAKKEIKEHYQRTLADFLEKIKVTTVDNVTMYEIETLSSKEMLKYAKTHIVEGSNMVVAYKQEGIVKEKKVCFVYLTYGNGDELLPDEKNKYVIIKADNMEEDVVNLFNESELIILK